MNTVGDRDVGPRAFPICKDHRTADWNQPQLEDDACILCRLFYLEAQEFEEWQQRAERAEAAIAEVKRPLDEQMARLNQTLTRRNGELEAARTKANEQRNLAESLLHERDELLDKVQRLDKLINTPELAVKLAEPYRAGNRPDFGERDSPDEHHDRSGAIVNAPEMRQDALPAQEKACEECRVSFPARRRWQRFCGPACRSEFHRKKALGPEGRISELERKVAALEERVTALEDPTAREVVRG